MPGKPTLFARTFDFEMKMTPSNIGFRLNQPAGPLISGPNSGELSVLYATLPDGLGFIDGSGLAADGVHTVGFGSRSQLPLEGAAFMFPRDGSIATELNGELVGMISMGVYKSSAGGFCYADKHTWKLKPKS